MKTNTHTHTIIKLILITFFSGCSLSLFAETTTEIYKWTDSDGEVHYAAKPGDSSAQKMHLGSKTFHKKSGSPKKEDTDKKKQEERTKFCKEYKETLAKYKKVPFLTRYDEQRKQKIRLTKEEHKAAMLQAEKDVSYWCNPPITDDKDDDDKG